MNTNPTPVYLWRQSKAINQKYCFRDYGMKSYLDLIAEGIITHAKITLEPAVRYRWIKSFRMDKYQQMRYEQKLQNKKVKVYNLYNSENCCFKVSKLIYDYFISTRQSKHQFV